MRKALVVIALLLLASLAVPASCVLADGNVRDVRIHLTGEPVLGIGSGSMYSGTLVDTQNRQWKYEVYVTADNVTGAAPTDDMPATGNLSAVNKTFTFEVTAPMKAGDLTIHVNISSMSGDKWYETTEIVKIVKPIVISATIDNPTDTIVSNATVHFYVDNLWIDTQTIGTLPAGQSTDVSAEWIQADFPPGWHDSTIEIDLDNDNAPEWILHDKFFIEGGSNLVLYLTIGVGLLALLGGIYFLSKRKLR